LQELRVEGVVRTFMAILQAITTSELLPRDSLLALICSILARLALDDQINTEIRMHNGVLLLGRLLTTPQLEPKVSVVHVLPWQSTRRCCTTRAS
jgi:hypothetical protein